MARDHKQEWLLGEIVEININDHGGPVNTLEVIALWILAMEVANAIEEAKNKAHAISDIGGMGVGANMACGP